MANTAFKEIQRKRAAAWQRLRKQTFGELATGSWFEYSGQKFIKTAFHVRSGTDEVNAVALRTGESFAFPKEQEVTKLMNMA